MTIYPDADLPYIATCGSEYVESAPVLADLLKTLRAIQERSDDIAVWRGSRLVLVMTGDGRILELDGSSICWRWPA